MRHQPVLQRSADRTDNSGVNLMSSKMPEEELYRLATNRVEEKKGFYIHFAVYLAVTALSVVYGLLQAIQEIGFHALSFPWAAAQSASCFTCWGFLSFYSELWQHIANTN